MEQSQALKLQIQQAARDHSIDADVDLNTPYTSPSGNVHGMPQAAALQEDNAMNKTILIRQPLNLGKS